MIGDAVEYPMAGADAVRTLVVGGGLYLALGSVGLVGWVLSSLAGWVIAPLVGLAAAVPAVLLAGYGVAVTRSLLGGEADPPAFEARERYARDGLGVAGIALVYGTPAAVLAVLGYVAFGVASLLPDEAGAVLGLLASLVGAVAVGGYVVAVLYAFPAAFVAYARSGEVGVAWDADRLPPVLLDREYAVAWVAGGAALFAATSIGASLAWVLVGFWVLFYGQLVALYLFTNGVAAALGDVRPAEPAGASVDHDADTPTTAAGSERVDESPGDVGET